MDEININQPRIPLPGNPIHSILNLDYGRVVGRSENRDILNKYRYTYDVDGQNRIVKVKEIQKSFAEVSCSMIGKILGLDVAENDLAETFSEFEKDGNLSVASLQLPGERISVSKFYNLTWDSKAVSMDVSRLNDKQMGLMEGFGVQVARTALFGHIDTLLTGVNLAVDNNGKWVPAIDFETCLKQNLYDKYRVKTGFERNVEYVSENLIENIANLTREQIEMYTNFSGLEILLEDDDMNSLKDSITIFGEDAPKFLLDKQKFILDTWAKHKGESQMYVPTNNEIA